MNLLDLSAPETRILPQLLQRQAREAPDTDFLIRDDTRISFGRADALTDALASGLESLGVARGDRVGMYLSGRPEAVLVPLAVNKLGAIWTPISTDYKGEWLADTLARSRCKVLVTESDLASRIEDVRDRLSDESIVVLEDGDVERPASTVSFASLLDAPPREFDCSDQHYGDTCSILWTSGTTGKSKGVLQSHNNWLRPIHRGATPQYKSQPGDVIYNVLPIFNSAAWVTSIFRALVEGIPCVLDGPFSVTHFWERIRKYGATETFTLGAMHMFLWNAPERPDDADNPLRAAQMVPMPPEIEGPFQERFGIEILSAGYGQSECLMICSTAFQDSPPGSLGFPMDDMELKLFDENDEEVAPGEPGEMRIHELEPHVLFNGYFDDEAATRDAYRGPNREWYCTGDLGRQDESGAFFFVDRKKDAIRFAGRNISTMEVESVVRRHPAVADVAAFGVTSKELAAESELKIDVVLAEDASLTYEDLAGYINDNAPHYFVPRYMEFVDSLPYTPTNKVEKYKLREKGVTAGTWDLRASTYQVRR
jgi:crotonobetaine/carnitine-CoA ligase